MKKTFEAGQRQLANDYIADLYAEGKWIIDWVTTESGTIEVQWIEQKTYVAHDGEVFPDEAWLTKDGELLLVQDLSAEHAKNVLRMIIRQDREKEKMVSDMFERIGAMLGSAGQDDDEEYDDDTAALFSATPSVPGNSTLH